MVCIAFACLLACVKGHFAHVAAQGRPFELSAGGASWFASIVDEFNLQYVRD